MSIRFLIVFTLIFFLTISTDKAFGQFGIAIKHAFDYEDIPNNVPGQVNERLLQHGGVIALDYRIKLVNYGIHFGPEIMAKMVRAKGIDIIDSNTEKIGEADNLRSLGINLPVTIFLFHFNQCDECPTFKRQHFFKNNFFIQPVIGYEMRNWTTDPADITEDINEHFIMGGLGIGVNIAASKLIKIQPTVQYKRNFGLNDNAHYKTKLQPSILEVGIRVGWGR